MASDKKNLWTVQPIVANLYPDSHIEFPIGTKITNLVEVHQIKMSAKLGFTQPCGFRLNFTDDNIHQVDDNSYTTFKVKWANNTGS